MKHKLMLSVVLCSIAALLLAGMASAQPGAVDGPNLLTNPGFESPYVKQCCHDEPVFFPNTVIDEVQVASGWSGWWLVPDSDPQHPGACTNCTAWHRPEWREANCGEACANRIHSGGNAQKYFTFWSVHDAGMFQQVTGVRPGARLRFSVYMQAWSTNENYGQSNNAQSMGMRVGIDPTGGTNGFSPNIIWSDIHDVYDAFGLYTIEAVAQSSTVTVFTRSTPFYGVQHNDIYVDDASLVVVGAGAVPASGQPAGSNTVSPQTPPEGTTEYIVRPGDTLWGISRRNGTTVARLMELNNLTSFQIRVGQRLIVGP